ncbi:MAG: tripartite tricarboxylate transporter substrate binding protein [Alphaproteobacteria bacterium]|nr:tripartite tricarboxylate transporter substrate binding protein [Alphaproteobacteria bacterium]
MAAMSGAGVGLLAAPGIVRAQAAWPTRAMRIVVPFAAGGGTDILARILAQEVGERLGQPMVADNRAGASGNIAMEHVARSAPDGYTVLMGTNGGTAANRHLFRAMPIDPVRDLEPVSLTFRSPHVLVVRNGLAARTVQDLVALARSQPGKLTYGHAGVGSMTHLAAALFTTKTNTDILAVSYRGGGLALTDLIAGNVDMLFDGFPSSVPNIREGRVRALAMCGTERSALFPEVPTMQQAGVPGYDAGTWQAVFGPRGMPRVAIERLVAACRAAAASPGYRERVVRAGAEATATSPEELAQILQRESDTWGEVIRAANISPT